MWVIEGVGTVAAVEARSSGGTFWKAHPANPLPPGEFLVEQLLQDGVDGPSAGAIEPVGSFLQFLHDSIVSEY